MKNLVSENIGFIGAGHLTSAMIFGLVNSGFPVQQIYLSNRSKAKLDSFQSQGINTTLENKEVMNHAKIIILAPRPADLEPLLSQIKDFTTSNHLLISVVAGIENHWIQSQLNNHQAIIRAMPNTPSKVQMSMTGLWANSMVNDKQKQLANELFQSMGKTLWLKDEDLIHSVTAIAGCGPAYFLEFMQAMVDAGMKIGLNKKEANKLVIQTAKGAAMMAELDKDSLSSLVSQIALPGGVTEKAISIFREKGLLKITNNAIQAAYNKSKNI